MGNLYNIGIYTNFKENNSNLLNNKTYDKPHVETIIIPVLARKLSRVREVEESSVTGSLVPKELGGSQEEDGRGEVGREGPGEEGELSDLKTRGERGRGGAVSKFPSKKGDMGLHIMCSLQLVSNISLI